MSCSRIEPELVTFHFGLIQRDARAEVEAHLASCPACLATFLTLKRDIEESAESSESTARPSELTRARIRASVAAEVAARAASRPRRRWEAPLAYAVASAAVVVAFVTTGTLAMGEGARPHGLSSEPAIAPVPATR